MTNNRPNPTDVFTEEQINAILAVLNTTRHTQYIGSRYVPIFGRKGETSIQWDNTGTYEPLTIVLYQGNSYTSRQFVPIGIDILNEDFWANTGNYNAQVEQYRQETIKAQKTAEDAQKTAEDALSLAQTNEADIALLGADITEINNKFDNNEIINFKDYTEKGANDDARLEYILNLNNINGKTLYFPKGTYTFTLGHKLPETFKIIGGDKLSTILKFNPTTEGELGAALFNIDSGNGYDISNLTFTSDVPLPTINNRNIPRHNYYLVYVAQKGNKNIYVHDINVAKYQLIMCGEPHIATNQPNECVTIANIIGGEWTNKNEGSHDITSAVIEIYNTNNWRVTGCILYNNQYWGGGCGIQCWGGNSIDSDTFRGGGTWLHDYAIDNNIIGHTQWSPIYTACGERGYICNNICYDCSDGAMSIEGARNTVITNNVLIDSNNYCIALANAMDNVIFTNNTLSQSGEIGRIGDKTPDGQTPHKRYRMIVRWGIRVTEDTSLHQSLTISNNKFTYLGNTDSTIDGQCVGTIEVGNDSGTLTFENNQLVNVMLSTFQKLITGVWGIAGYQLQYFKPCRTSIKNNTFIFDDADMRVAQDGTPFNKGCIYISPSFGEPIEVIGNKITSIKYALNAIPIVARAIYVTREAGNESYVYDTSQNKGMFIIDNNQLLKFDKILDCWSSSGNNDMDIIFRNNIIQTSEDWEIVRHDATHKVNLFLYNNFKQLIDKTNNNINYIQPLIAHIPHKDSDLYAMLAVGTDLTYFGAQTLGGKQYHTITKVTGGFKGCGEIGPLVSDF